MSSPLAARARRCTTAADHGLSANSLSRRKYILNTGDKIPAIGLGTWQSKPHEVTAAVITALQAGYRHIDTAAAYGNEHEVGMGIVASGVPRDQVWITTKLNNPDHKRAAEALESSLKNLGVDHIDLWLMHWPSSTIGSQKLHYEDWDYCDTWAEMQKAIGTGKVRNIGVSNFGIIHLQTLLADPRTTVRSCRCFRRRNQSYTLTVQQLDHTRGQSN